MKRLLVTVAALLALAAPAAHADKTKPTLYSAANVDGNIGEWDLTNDFFANIYRAGKSDKPLEAKAYARYDCVEEVMYILYLTEPGVPLLVDGDAWIAIGAQNNKVVNDDAGDDGVAPDFAFVGVNYDGDPNHARGYEASFPLAPGTYELIIHGNVFDDGLKQTGATEGFPGDGIELDTTCTPVATESTTWGAVKSLIVQ
ncbi:MAG TPA: hypothetical protein VF720_13110 [Candidatus Eisenbacteria bacterium]